VRTEDDLRRALADAAADVPTPAGARAAVGARARRQRAARTVPLVVLVVAAIGLGVARSSGHHRSSLVTTRPPERQAAVPTTMPPVTTQPTTGTPAKARTGAPPPCATSQLGITGERASGAPNHGSVLVLFRNSGARCHMSGYPGVAAIDRAGRRAGFSVGWRRG
jgi:hypothetical protein